MIQNLARHAFPHLSLFISYLGGKNKSKLTPIDWFQHLHRYQAFVNSQKTFSSVPSNYRSNPG